MRRAVLLAALLFPAPAAAQDVTSSVTFSPDRAGRPSGITTAFTARAVDRAPDSVSVFTPAGMALDPKAVAVRCSDAAAGRGACPSRSRVGEGEVRLQTIIGPLGATGSAFLGVARRGERAALWLALDGFSRTLRASVKRSGGGYVVRLTGLASDRRIPPGAVREISGELRLLAKRRTVRRRGGRRTTYHLVRNPRRCPTGGWRGRVELAFGSDVRRVDYAAPCRP